MSHNFRNALFILFILGGSSVVAQVPLLQNQEAVQAIKITLDQIYNFQFE